MKYNIEKWEKRYKTAVMLIIFTLAYPMPVLAAELVTAPINTLYDIVAAVVSGIGGVRLLYGVFDWANAHAQHDTSAKSQALTGIVAGIMMILGSQLARAILTA